MKFFVNYYDIAIAHFIKILDGGEIYIYKNEIPHSLIVRSSQKFYIYPLDENMVRQKVILETTEITTAIYVLKNIAASANILPGDGTKISIIDFDKETILNIINFKELLELDKKTAYLLNKPFYTCAQAISDTLIFTQQLKKRGDTSSDMVALIENLESILNSSSNTHEYNIRLDLLKLFSNLVSNHIIEIIQKQLPPESRGF